MGLQEFLVKNNQRGITKKLGMWRQPLLSVTHRHLPNTHSYKLARRNHEP